MPDLSRRLARIRVPLGFLGSAAALWFAAPTWPSMAAGLPVAVLGEVIRVWAAGHLEKGREVTQSGPYRWTGHPLYLGSSVMAAGFVIAAHSLVVAFIAAAYVGVTFIAAIRSEQAELRAAFGQAYEDYRTGRASGVSRSFSLSRAMRNREYRAVLGLAGAMILLALKIVLVL